MIDGGGVLGAGRGDDDDPPILPPSSAKSSSKKSTAKPTSSVKRLKSNSKKTSKSKAPHGISGDRLLAGDAARDMLHTTVPRLPVPLNENYVVRNFGQLNITQNGVNAYSTPTSLYPVGFSCDRFEFSPVHGRLLKLRCTIIDGQRTNRGFAGPIFRVMWGQGVDEAVPVTTPVSHQQPDHKTASDPCDEACDEARELAARVQSNGLECRARERSESKHRPPARQQIAEHAAGSCRLSRAKR